MWCCCWGVPQKGPCPTSWKRTPCAGGTGRSLHAWWAHTDTAACDPPSPRLTPATSARWPSVMTHQICCWKIPWPLRPARTEKFVIRMQIKTRTFTRKLKHLRSSTDLIKSVLLTQKIKRATTSKSTATQLSSCKFERQPAEQLSVIQIHSTRLRNNLCKH